MALKLNNKQDRLDFLKKYRTWEMLYHLKEVHCIIYRYKLANGMWLFARETYSPRRDEANVSYCIYSPTISEETLGYSYFDTFCLSGHSTNEILGFLTKHKDEI